MNREQRQMLKRVAAGEEIPCCSRIEAEAPWAMAKREECANWRILLELAEAGMLTIHMGDGTLGITEAGQKAVEALRS